ncbi:molybdopterin cofactor-binding domain-containing protein [Wukongibacter baidiensis]|uniref:xanthine dehydrogenase family protein molybdopterin-binding subunit n=1 Tax=Wukongibacter baidiensis TaxID=1723361 RepID=UPI003D7FE611
MVDKFKYIGKSFPIHDADKKVRGEVIYAGDMKRANMLHAKLLFSPIAHGIVKKIDTSRAEELDGVVKVFTHLNSPGKPFNRYRTISKQGCCPEDELILTDKVRFVGDRVAAVVAESLEIANKAIDLIEVEYEELPIMINTKESLKEDAANIHTRGNLVGECDLEVGNSNEEFEEEKIEVKSYIKTQKMHHVAMETHAYIADFDNTGKLTIWTPTQGVYGVRTVVADLLELKYNNVRVIKPPMGGSFGAKQEFILEPLVAFMAKETKRAVKLQFDRKESIIATMTRPANETKIRTSFSENGQLLECHVDNTLDAGAYAGSSLDQIHAMLKKIPRLYRISRYKHKIKAVYTNTPVAGGMRGWGSPEMITPMEIHMDQVARKLKIDPVELRLRNLVHPYDVDTSTNLSLGNCRAIECLEKGAEHFDWKNRGDAKKTNRRYIRGIGVACGAHKNGMYGGGFPDFTSMTLKMNEDGSFNLISCLHDVGCGTVTSMKLIVAEVLDIAPDLISVSEGDTDSTPYDFGSYGSRVTYVAGACAKKVAESVKEKILLGAEMIFQRPKEHLEIGNGEVRIRGKEKSKLSYREIATTTKFKHETDIIATETHRSKSNPGVYGAHFAEVEVDTLTGLARVTDYLAVQDIGKAINRGMVEGQVQGAVQLGIGYALCEEIKIDDNGKVINDSFAKYHVINAPDMPDVKVLLVEDGGDDGPFGAKSVGEIATVPVAAAVVNAVNNALGTNLSDLPLTPEKIIEALKNH